MSIIDCFSRVYLVGVILVSVTRNSRDLTRLELSPASHMFHCRYVAYDLTVSYLAMHSEHADVLTVLVLAFCDFLKFYSSRFKKISLTTFVLMKKFS